MPQAVIEGGRAHQGEEGAEEAAFAVPDGLQGVAQHHEALGLSSVVWVAVRFGVPWVP